MSEFFSHLGILLCRNTRLFVVDRTGMWLALLQAPFIALFIALALHGSGEDCRQSDEIMRKSYAFVSAVQKDRKNTEVMYEQPRLQRGFIYLEEADAKKHNGILSPTHAQARATIFFVMISASIWMGLLGSCKEIVTEWSVIHRESHSSFSVWAYVLSKLTVLGVVLLFQVFCLTLITVLLLLRDDFTCKLFLGHFALNWLAGFCASALGLLLSCVISSVRWALALVPVIMMPQILMGGLLRPPAQILPEQKSTIREVVSSLTFQRWAFEAELVLDTRLGQPDGEAPVSRRVAMLSEDTTENSLLYKPKCDDPALDEYFFKGKGGNLSSRIKNSLVVLVTYALVLTFMTIFCLILRILGANHGNRLCA